VWTYSVPERYATVIGGIGPRATPTLDGGQVFALGATGLLSALDLHSGELLWSHHVVKEHAASTPDWAKSCSPLVVDEKVIVSVGAPEGWSLVAYHRDSGAVLWHAGDDLSSYSSPLLAELAGEKQVLIFNQSSLTSHSLQTGEILWKQSWSSAQPNVAQPLILPGNKVLLSSGYGIGSKLFQIQRSERGTDEDTDEDTDEGTDEGTGGEVWTVEELWESRRLKAKFATPIATGGYIYGLDDGILTCIDAAAGERQWKGGRYGHGQIMLVEDLLLIQSEGGDVVLVEATPEEHRELGRLPALGSKTWNPPMLSGSTLLLRNDQEAVAFALPTASS
jgi:outer membrane protein assembly factor BamB